MSTGKLRKISYNNDSARPVLVNFQNGALISDKIPKLKCELYKEQEDNFIAAVASDKTIYSSKISRKDELYNHFILTHNTKNGECKLIAIDKVLLNIVSKSKRKLDITDTSAQKTLSDLSKYFGSKKSKMITEQNERLKVDVGNIKDTLEQTAKETHVNESDIVAPKVDDNGSTYRPPINRNAKKVEEVYPLHVLLLPELLEELKEGADELLETDEENLKLCEFIKNQVVKLQQSTSEDRNTKAQLFLYIDCLINFVKQHAKIVSAKKYIACSYSKKVNEQILNNFTLMSTNGRTRPISMRDKCICYILVLSMLAFNNILNLELFTKDLKLSIKKLHDISKVLAFTSKGNNKNIVTLSLPLPPPVSVSAKRKRK